jgi:hypothetical protein
LGRSGLVRGPGDGSLGVPTQDGWCGEPVCAIKHPAVMGLDCQRAPVAVVGEMLGCQRAPAIAPAREMTGANISSNVPTTGPWTAPSWKKVFSSAPNPSCGRRGPWLSEPPQGGTGFIDQQAECHPIFSRRLKSNPGQPGSRARSSYDYRRRSLRRCRRSLVVSEPFRTDFTA